MTLDQAAAPRAVSERPKRYILAAYREDAGLKSPRLGMPLKVGGSHQ